MAARILVADDSVTIQKVVELTFSKEDFVLVQARNGEEAIRKAKEQRPDLVLLDLVMPDKNGYEVCAALRKEPALRTVPILLLTGTFEAFDKNKGFQAGANDFITKPFESQALISKVKQLLFAGTIDLVTPPVVSTASPPREAARPVPATPPAPLVTPPGAATVPAWSSAPVAPPPPTATSSGGRMLDFSPPSEEITQDRARRAVEVPPSGFDELSLKDLASIPLPETPSPPKDLQPSREKAAPDLGPLPEELSLEVPPQAPLLTPKAEAASVPRGRSGLLPQSLSLEDVMSAEATAPPRGAEGAFAPLEDLPGGPVFDLTGEMGAPSLPLVEVGTGEPPALSIEDLLASAEMAPPAPGEEGLREVSGPEIPPGELPGAPGFELMRPEEAVSPPTLEVGVGEAPDLSVEDLVPPGEGAPSGAAIQELPEPKLELIPEAPAEPAPSGEPAPEGTAPLDLGMLVEVPLTDAEQIDIETALMGGQVPVSPPASAMEAGTVAEEVPAAPVAPPEVAESPVAPAVPPIEAVGPAAMTPPAGAQMAHLPELVEMRQAVTERVARELARDLSDKLLERIEQIVWEVVPDLAEILLTREIERIRSQAEGKQST